jgi:hypothetical protein
VALHAVADDDYMEDETVGGMFGPGVIRKALVKPLVI